jgi:hypothetical protein
MQKGELSKRKKSSKLTLLFGAQKNIPNRDKLEKNKQIYKGGNERSKQEQTNM